jgi:hypothetical protein
MTEISSAKRAIIIKYRFYDHLTFQDISNRLTDVSREDDLFSGLQTRQLHQHRHRT